VLLAELPSDSATARSLNGGERPWTPLEHLLAGIFDTLQVLAWQNANQGRKSPTKRPTPLPRPGIEPSGVHYGKPRPLSEVKAMLASTRPGADRALGGG
jgi:hypothetical protein